MGQSALKQRHANSYGAVLVVIVGLLAIYVVGLPPSLTWVHHGADGGDLATAVLRGSIPHPPGSPTYLLLSEFFIRLPWGDPAWRLNLMSAVLAAGAAGLTIAHRQYSTIVRISAGLLLGLAPLWWSQALITEVYAPAAFSTALTLYLLQHDAPGWVIGLVWGIGLGTHPTLIFLAPVVLITNRERPHALQTLVAAAGMTLLLYGPVLLIRGKIPFPWGDFQSWDGWWTFVTAKLYRHYLFALPFAALPQRLIAWLSLLAQQFTPIGALLAGGGWWVECHERPFFAWTSLFAFLSWSGYALWYNTADSLVYLVAALPLAAFWLIAGLDRAYQWLQQQKGDKFGAILLMLPLIQGWVWGPRMTLRRDQTAASWAEATLTNAPSNAVLITMQDGHTFALWYAQAAWNRRPDVMIIDSDLWVLPSYRRFLAESLGVESLTPGVTPEQVAREIQRPWQMIISEIPNER